jgi:hypothetical protein
MQSNLGQLTKGPIYVCLYYNHYIVLMLNVAEVDWGLTE